VLQRGVTEIAVDPRQPSQVYAVSQSAVDKSTDGGVTWNALPLAYPGIASLLVDPIAEGTLYAYSGQPVKAALRRTALPVGGQKSPFSRSTSRCQVAETPPEQPCDSPDRWTAPASRSGGVKAADPAPGGHRGGNDDSLVRVLWRRVP
jgi:hypothetical protein